MDTNAGDVTILKTDVLGRVKTSLERREHLLDEFELSGLSGCKYAELVGVKYQTFATWLQKRKRARGAYPKLPARPAAKAQSVQWLEAVVREARQSAPGSGSGIVLELRGGGRVEISSAKQLGLAVALLRELEKPC